MKNKRTWLQEKRIKKEMNHEQVAQEAGIQRAYYTMIENGNRDPSVEVAKRIAQALGFNWIIFFEDQCNETKQPNTA